MKIVVCFVLFCGVLVVQSYICSHQINTISQLGGCIVYSLDGSNPRKPVRDGYLTCKEIDGAAFGGQWDLNGDGCLNRSEFVSSWKRYFHDDEVAVTYFFDNVDCDQNGCYDGCESLKDKYCHLTPHGCPGPTLFTTADVTGFLRVLHPMSGTYAPQNASCRPDAAGGYQFHP